MYVDLMHRLSIGGWQGREIHTCFCVVAVCYLRCGLGLHGCGVSGLVGAIVVSLALVCRGRNRLCSG